MRHASTILAISAVTFLALSGPAVAQRNTINLAATAAGNELTAGRIRAAVDDALMYLRSQQAKDGSIQSNDGYTALAALAMLAAGGDPAADTQLAKALDWLAGRTPDNTYIRGILRTSGSTLSARPPRTRSSASCWRPTTSGCGKR